MYNFFKRWSEINEDIKVNVRNFAYYNQLKQILIGNIKLVTDSDRLSFNMLNYAIDRVCIIDKNKNLYSGWIVDQPNNDGSWTGHEVQAHSYYNADTFSGVVGKDCEVLFFNPFHTSESLLYQLADQLNNIDIWEQYAIDNSKNNPFIVVDNEKDKLSIERALNESDKGKRHVMVGASLINKILRGSNKGMENPYLTLNYNDINAMTIVQYSCEYRDNLIKRFATLYGHANYTSSKHAQVNSDEISGNRSMSFLYIDAIMKELKEGIERINTLLGSNWTVEWCEVEQALIDDEMNDAIKDDVEIDNDGKGVDDETDVETDNNNS